MTKKYGLKEMAGDALGVIFAVPTFGASMVLSPSARGLVGNLLGSGGDDNDNSGILQAQQNYQTQMEQWKLLSEERRKDLENLRKDKEEVAEKIKQNDNEMDRLRAIINDPSKSEDEKNNARRQLVVLEGENESLKRRLGDLEKKIKDTEDEKPPVPTTPSAP